ncbi:MAG: 4-hydroxythreonine-4-phosphate dehydrogenase PdxA [Bacteroidales bacterium]|jgi:4-hydroxythreonine-4-phosphate dehydrogenase|nr:4-hydroxythreonine-4-phosphate dehydrogenase PdxA [Bacteroidales bacterium]
MQKIAITQGECGSINYELLVRVFLDSAFLETLQPVLFGSSKILSMVAKSMGQPLFLQKAKKINIDEVIPVSENISYSRGTATKTSGEMAVKALENAVQQLKPVAEGGALLTLPVDGDAIRLSRPEFKNQASLIASYFSEGNPYRMFLSENLKTTFMLAQSGLTGGLAAVSAAAVKKRILALHETFKRDFSIFSPRIAVLSMNEDVKATALCENDKQILTPVINELQVNGNAVFGPYTTAQALEMIDNFDVFLCIYREQQELLFKDKETSSLCFFTAGLPIVHVEPHLPLEMGQVSDWQALEIDLRNAIYWGIDILSNRQENAVLLSNTLGFSNKDFVDVNEAK